MKSIAVRKSRGIHGTITVPGDKSITHRAIILGSLARGTTVVKGYLPSDDCLHTASAFRSMGVSIQEGRTASGPLRIEGKGLRGLSEPSGVLDLGNSGTGLRLLAGVLAGQDFFSVLTGDESLRRRPMRRVVDPLRRMGAEIDGREGGNMAPLAVRGRRLQGIAYALPVASAQVKSALLLAGLLAEGRTVLAEPLPSRDHTERMFRGLGISVEVEGLEISLKPPSEFSGREIEVPGDFSSAAFFIVAATIVKDSELMIRHVGVNPTRTGLLELLSEMGAEIRLENLREVNHEPVADLAVRSRPLKGISIRPESVPKTIDEFPILCVAAAVAEGETVVQGAEELRVKESDRIRTIARELSKLGVDLKERPDGLVIRGGRKLSGARCRSEDDHRIAMALAIAGLVAEGETVVEGAEWIETSFPGFPSLLKSVTG
ncbi:MAG TPA: 3-phosphoshikimate 1-carboxyvinyltransferase [Nitrospiria bacterium]|jgi:3-phosphoshikimate 1-carboxyvinyltransferase|nr:3-phosphoshikimate 1-carboxyvinyltransferase [Nitrospiria bacterium]